MKYTIYMLGLSPEESLSRKTLDWLIELNTHEETLSPLFFDAQEDDLCYYGFLPVMAEALAPQIIEYVLSHPLTDGGDRHVFILDGMQFELVLASAIEEFEVAR